MGGLNGVEWEQQRLLDKLKVEAELLAGVEACTAVLDVRCRVRSKLGRLKSLAMRYDSTPESSSTPNKTNRLVELL